MENENELIKKAVADIQSGYHTDFTVKMSLYALRKAIPQQVLWDGSDEQDFVRCPACKTILGTYENLNYFGKPNYCENCGQALEL